MLRKQEKLRIIHELFLPCGHSTRTNEPSLTGLFLPYVGIQHAQMNHPWQGYFCPMWAFNTHKWTLPDRVISALCGHSTRTNEPSLTGLFLPYVGIQHAQMNPPWQGYFCPMWAFNTHKWTIPDRVISALCGHSTRTNEPSLTGLFLPYVGIQHAQMNHPWQGYFCPMWAFNTHKWTLPDRVISALCGHSTRTNEPSLTGLFLPYVGIQHAQMSHPWQGYFCPMWAFNTHKWAIPDRVISALCGHSTRTNEPSLTGLFLPYVGIQHAQMSHPWQGYFCPMWAFNTHKWTIPDRVISALCGHSTRTNEPSLTGLFLPYVGIQHAQMSHPWQGYFCPMWAFNTHKWTIPDRVISALCGHSTRTNELSLTGLFLPYVGIQHEQMSHPWQGYFCPMWAFNTHKWTIPDRVISALCGHSTRTNEPSLTGLFLPYVGIQHAQMSHPWQGYFCPMWAFNTHKWTIPDRVISALCGHSTRTNEPSLTGLFLPYVGIQHAQMSHPWQGYFCPMWAFNTHKWTIPDRVI